MRVAEVTAIKVGNIDSERMLIRVERGRGGRYRNAILSTDLLALVHRRPPRDGVVVLHGPSLLFSAVTPVR